jgi:AraC-like DNA-binding protein
MFNFANFDNNFYENVVNLCDFLVLEIMSTPRLNRISLETISSANPYRLKNLILYNGSDDIAPNFSIEDPFSLDGVILGLCLKGSATLLINFKEFKIEKFATLTVLPYQTVQVVEKSDDFIWELLLFSFDFFSGLKLPNDFHMLAHLATRPCVPVSDEVMHNLMNYHHFIVKQYNNSDKAYRPQIIRGLLYALLLEISSLYKDQDDVGDTICFTRQEEITLKFLICLTENHRYERSVGFYADKLCLTGKYLSQIIKEVTGYPVMRWIDQMVINEAKAKLKTTDLSVLQISEELNFPNASFFGQYFKKNTGMTPHKYRTV